MLTTSDLSGMRATQDLFLTDHASIIRPTATSDGTGGEAISWNEREKCVPCRVAPPSAREVQIASKIAESWSHVITMPAETDVRLSDRVKVGAITYEVVGALSGGSWQTATRVLVLDLKLT